MAVHCYSNLRMTAQVEQASFSPGADLMFRAALTEYNLPVERRAQVHVELTQPGGALTVVKLAETEPGIFTGSFSAMTQGVYHARFLAKGVTLRGLPFTREQTGSGAVWAGGDQPYHHPDGRGGKDGCGCIDMHCLLDKKVISRELEERLKRAGINLDYLRRCLAGSRVSPLKRVKA